MGLWLELAPAKCKNDGQRTYEGLALPLTSYVSGATSTDVASFRVEEVEDKDQRAGSTRSHKVRAAYPYNPGTMMLRLGTIAAAADPGCMACGPLLRRALLDVFASDWRLSPNPYPVSAWGRNMEIDVEGGCECDAELARNAALSASLCDDQWKGERAACFHRAWELRASAPAAKAGRERAALEARAQAGFAAVCADGDARACMVVAQTLEQTAHRRWDCAHPKERAGWLVDAAEWMKPLTKPERAKWASAIDVVCHASSVPSEVRGRACARPGLATPGHAAPAYHRLRAPRAPRTRAASARAWRAAGPAATRACAAAARTCSARDIALTRTAAATDVDAGAGRHSIGSPHAAQQARWRRRSGSLASLGSPPRSTSADCWGGRAPRPRRPAGRLPLPSRFGQRAQEPARSVVHWRNALRSRSRSAPPRPRNGAVPNLIRRGTRRATRCLTRAGDGRMLLFVKAGSSAASDAAPGGER